MSADLVYLVAGLCLILAVLLPAVLRGAPVTTPMLLIGTGMLIGLTPLPEDLPIGHQDNRALIEHATELTVIVALMGVGLAIDRPLDLRRLSSWRTWSPAWRLLGIAMPLSIASVALLGWTLGAAPAARRQGGWCLPHDDSCQGLGRPPGATPRCDALERGHLWHRPGLREHVAADARRARERGS